MKIELDNGKYTYINDEQGQRALRHGLQWRNLVGDNLVLHMAYRIKELESQKFTQQQAQAMYEFIELAMAGYQLDATVAESYGYESHYKYDSKAYDELLNKLESNDG